MKNDFFYSKKVNLHISSKPLKIDARVAKAAHSIGIKLDWDDSGYIINIDFDDALCLLKALSSRMLTPIEYWQVFEEVHSQNNLSMIKELCSDEYTEWLNRIYLEKRNFGKIQNIFIDSPVRIKQYKYKGNKVISKCPFGRPGWFNPKNNIGKTGEPLKVILLREKFSTSWKYWSADISVTKLKTCAPIRGYVTSVGKPSYDLGIPVDSRQPKLMIRECRTIPLTPSISDETLKCIQTSGQTLLDLVSSNGGIFAKSTDSQVIKYREQLIDKIGNIALSTKLDIQLAANKICPIRNKKLSYKNFAQFIKSSRKRLVKALTTKSDIIFVMGHKNPDTDAAISSLFEAYRNHILESNLSIRTKKVYIPIIQSHKIPDEVNVLVGSLSKQILLFNNPLYIRAKCSGLSRWISVDQNREPDVQKFFISILDHHRVCESAQKRDLPKTLEMLGSTAAIITRKYIGMGLVLDRELANLLYCATLMDTENRVAHKMTLKDEKIMNYLKKLCGCTDDDAIYSKLMSSLLHTNDTRALFERDYKEDWGFGFAVAKIKGGFDSKGGVIKKKLFSKLKKLAIQNNAIKNFPLTLVKITDYLEDNKTVQRERVYFIVSKKGTIFEKTIQKTLCTIIKFEFPESQLVMKKDYIEFWGGGLQLSRKKTAPVIEPICQAFNRYFYSPTINKWVARDFLRKTKSIIGKCHTDEVGRVNYLTFPEAKRLALDNKFTLLSLSDFWNVLNDAKKSGDVQMINSLQGSNFVEFLDTVVLDKSIIINHDGRRQKSKIPIGNPGLLHPADVDIKTGIPKKILPPNIYGNPDLWRYWEPDSDNVIFCRSYIFLLNQPCLDGKVHPTESFLNLGIRQVIEKVLPPKIFLKSTKKLLFVKIHEFGEIKVWKWPKNIWDMQCCVL